MKDRELLWCALNLLLDDEEELSGLCPTCRARAEEQRCAGCGAPLAQTDGGRNESFDEERFLRLSRGDER